MIGCCLSSGDVVMMSLPHPSIRATGFSRPGGSLRGSLIGETCRKRCDYISRSGSSKTTSTPGRASSRLTLTLPAGNCDGWKCWHFGRLRVCRPRRFWGLTSFSAGARGGQPLNDRVGQSVLYENERGPHSEGGHLPASFSALERKST